MGLEFLVPVLVSIIVVAILVYALRILLIHLGTPGPIQNLVFLLVLVVVLIWLINYLGVL